MHAPKLHRKGCIKAHCLPGASCQLLMHKQHRWSTVPICGEDCYNFAQGAYGAAMSKQSALLLSAQQVSKLLSGSTTAWQQTVELKEHAVDSGMGSSRLQAKVRECPPELESMHESTEKHQVQACEHMNTTQSSDQAIECAPAS